MSGPMNHAAFVDLLDEDIEWLKTMPGVLERDHILCCLTWLKKREAYEAINGPPPEPTALASADGAPVAWAVGQARRFSSPHIDRVLRLVENGKDGWWSVADDKYGARQGFRVRESEPSDLVTGKPDPAPAKRCETWCGDRARTYLGEPDLCSPECRAAGRPVHGGGK